MRTARSLWIAETVVTFALVAMISSQLSGGEARYFFFAELPIFAVSFLLALLLGGPGKILALGVGLAFAAATLLALGGSSSTSCGEICFGFGELFVFGLIVAGALYPGWAFGTGLGALARLQLDAKRDRVAVRSSR